MKKMIVLIAAIMLATVTQAAAVGWNMAGATNFKGGSYGVFVVGMNGVTSASQIAALVAADGLDSVSSYMFASGTVANTGAATTLAASSGKSIEYKDGGTAAENTYTAFIFVQDAAAENASYSNSASITLANNSTGKNFAFNNQSSALSANNFTVNVPEPTSGLMLLLGMAGLALKRKRA